MGYQHIATLARRAIEPKAPMNTVVVNKESDFPAANAGVITLQDDTTYIIGSPIVTSNRFVLQGSQVIMSSNANLLMLTYTGTGTMFTGVDTTTTIQNLTTNCANGQCYDISASGGNEGVPTIRFFQYANVSCDVFGTFANMRNVQILNAALLGIATDGIAVSGTVFTRLTFTNFAMVMTAGTAIDFGTVVIPNLQIEKFEMTLLGASVGITGLTNSGNIPTGSLGTVFESVFLGPGTPITNITSEDVRWEFKDSNVLSSSTVSGDTFLSSATTTTINTIGVYEPIGSTNWVSDIESRITGANTGILTYNFERNMAVLIIATASVEKSGGGSDVIGLRIAVNGTTLAKSEATTDNPTPSSISAVALTTLSETDTVQAYVANFDTTSNIEVVIANLSITASG